MNNNMVILTKEDAEKLYNENAKQLIFKFVYYYKYVFNFVAENENIKVEASFGGSADDIYRLEIKNSEVDVPQNFETLLNNYNSVNIEDKKHHPYFIYNSY